MSPKYRVRPPAAVSRALATTARIICRALKWAIVACWVGVGMIIAVPLCHRYLNFCPIHLKSFADDAFVPVLYGHVWSFGGGIRDDIRAGAERGDYVIAGSCTTLGFSHVCPLCNWPARFESEEEIQMPTPETISGKLPSNGTP